MKPRDRHHKLLNIWIVIAICTVLSIAALYYTQIGITTDTKYEDIQKRIAEIPVIMDNAQKTASDSQTAFDNLNQSRANTMAYLLQKYPEAVKSSHEEFTSVADIVRESSGINVLVLSKDGRLLNSYTDPGTDFTKPRYNMLRTVFDSSASFSPFYVLDMGQSTVIRYYAAKIDEEYEVVFAVDYVAQLAKIGQVNNLYSILQSFSSNSEGTVYAISASDHIIKYAPDQDLINRDITALGVNPQKLHDGQIAHIAINGTKYISGTCDIMNGAYKIICVDPISAASTTDSFGIIVTVLICFAAFLLAGFSCKEHAEETIHDGLEPVPGETPETWEQIGKDVHLTIRRLIFYLLITGGILAFLIGYYLQSISSLSVMSGYQQQALTNLSKTVSDNSKSLSDIRTQMAANTLSKTIISSSVLSDKPEMRNTAELQKLAQALQLADIRIYDAGGNLVCDMSGDLLNINISNDQDEHIRGFSSMINSTSYSISDIIKDAPSAAQSALEDSTFLNNTDSAGSYQYGAMILATTDHKKADGFVLIKSYVTFLDKIVSSAEISNVLQTVHCSAGGFMMEIDDNADSILSSRVVYPTDSSFSGKTVSDLGLTDANMATGFIGYLNLNSVSYFGQNALVDGKTIFALSASDYYRNEMLKYALVAALCVVIGILITGICVSRIYKKEFRSGEPTIDPVSPKQSIPAVQPASSSAKLLQQLFNNSVPWSKQNASQKTVTILNGVLAVYAAIATLAVLFRDSLFSSNSVIRYVLGTNWQKGMNIFSITASIFIVSMIYTISLVLIKLLQFLERVLEAKGRTICKLICSVIQYGAVIISLFYILALFGVDTKTLLASAGIIGIGVSLGSKELVSDILAGLFIVFEDQFHVGDQVIIGGWTGTVIDIGVRTTKVINESGSIKSFPNDQVSGGLVNLPHNTRANVIPVSSACTLNFTISLNQSLDRVEEILTEELPKLRDAIPEIQEGPEYTGVSELASDGAVIGVRATCAQKDNEAVQKKLLRKMLSIFEHNGIILSAQQNPGSAAGSMDTAPKTARSSRKSDDLF
ncbi:MAG: mechanosensitive ion channel family protein [Lachnospiraceae bacterium]|jgi:small-conductance mechanosensitive channel|nr:mechanosensitive ion channel family protein [Lachnospiraceae bacterium]